jgi:uncharacterized protein (UPF0335 family)
MALDELQLIETHIERLEREAMSLMKEHQDVVQRVAEVPGFGVDSALQMIAEVGSKAATFRTAKKLSSWVGVCPGNEESAGESHSTRSPKGNHHMRRLLNQAAQSAVKVKGSIFELTFSRLLPRLGYQQAIWAIAHRLCRVLWVILHAGVRYEERGPAVSAKSKRTRAARMVRELKKLGYRVEGGTTPCGHSGMNGWGFSNLSTPPTPALVTVNRVSREAYAQRDRLVVPTGGRTGERSGPIRRNPGETGHSGVWALWKRNGAQGATQLRRLCRIRAGGISR